MDQQPIDLIPNHFLNDGRARGSSPQLSLTIKIKIKMENTKHALTSGLDALMSFIKDEEFQKNIGTELWQKRFERVAKSALRQVAAYSFTDASNQMQSFKSEISKHF